jgi:hypothetical protein
VSCLDRFDVVILDHIRYVQQDRQEVEALFTFLAERYERRGVVITSNRAFPQWDQILKHAMTMAAGIDWLLHHATILELSGTSYRTETAKLRRAEAAAEPDTRVAPQRKHGAPIGGPPLPRGQGPATLGVRGSGGRQCTEAVVARHR